MNKKTTGILAGAAGAALLLGGGTFALWSDSSSVSPNTIVTGNLDIEAACAPVLAEVPEIRAAAAECSTAEWFDTSGDRNDSPHPIVIGAAEGSWRAVPGDEATGYYYFAGALEGDNLVATLGATVTTPAEVVANHTVTHVVEYFDGTTWNPVLAPAQFRSVDNTANAALPTLPKELEDANIRVVVTVTVGSATGSAAPGAGGNVGTQAELAVDGFVVNLTQVRAA